MPEIPVPPWMMAAAAYPVLQTVALVRLTGILFTMSLIVTVTMVAVIGLTASAFYLDPSNLWQMFPMLAVPPALVVTTGLLALGSVVGRREQTYESRPEKPQETVADAWPTAGSVGS